MRIAVVGVGQELLGDDAAGLAVCSRLDELLRSSSDSSALGRAPALVLAAGPAPENCTAQLRRFAPDRVVLVDAARMDAPPGTVRWIPCESADGIGGSTHTLPLRLLCEYLTASLGCRVDLLGIQPAGTELGAPLSEAARAGVETAASQLAELLRLPDLIAVPQEAYR
jgi:hydrogenase 3 maturation protease